MTSSEKFQEKELNILRDAVDRVEKQEQSKVVNSPEVKKIISIVERFLQRKKLICYGGTAINNILPVHDQFYDKTIEIPDYDFFSPNALNDAKELADIYAEQGYEEVESKAGVHHGTYKVFVNFIPVADITQINREIYRMMGKESITVNGIRYAPPNYLRMAMYLELSRPKGDVSRWEKVLKRLILLNKNYPMKDPRCGHVDFIREFEGDKNKEHIIYETVKNSLIDQGVIFFGGYASSLYGKYMPASQKKKLKQIPDFDVLSDDPKISATIVKERLQDAGVKKIKLKKRSAIGEIISEHYEVTVDKDTVCFIYKPLACHSYNTIPIHQKRINVATIDTMLSFYLAFLYADRPYYDHERILCMAQYLFTVQSKNRLQQKGLLRRFTIKCYGDQKTLEDSRAEKTEKFKELKSNRNSREFQEYFLRYIPHEIGRKSGTRKSGTRKSGTRKSGTRKSGTRKSGTRKSGTRNKRSKVKK